MCVSLCVCVCVRVCDACARVCLCVCVRVCVYCVTMYNMNILPVSPVTCAHQPEVSVRSESDVADSRLSTVGNKLMVCVAGGGDK